MTINWSIHEAEIRRLYWSEGQPLQQVREILSREHGFEASVRSWRSILSEWGLLKRTLPNSDRHKRKIASRAISHMEETPHRPDSSSKDAALLCRSILVSSTSVYQSNRDYFLCLSYQNPPARASLLNICGDWCQSDLYSGTYPALLRTPTQIKELLEQPSNLCYGLEILISEWRPSIALDLLEMAKQFLSEYVAQLDIWRQNSSGLSIFDVMERHKNTMSYSDMESLARLCLEADIKFKHNSEDFSSSLPEGIQWRKAYHACSWRDAMHAFGSMKSKFWSSGGFRNMAILIIADHRLSTLEDSLECHIDSISPGDVSTEFLAESEEYLEILKQLADSSMEIKPSWYLLSLKLHSWSSFHESAVRGLLEGHLEIAETKTSI